MSNFYFTFGTDHKTREGMSLWNFFVKIQAEKEEEARLKMYEKRGLIFAFCYTEKEFKGQIEEFNLKEIRLEEVKLDKTEEML